MICIEAGKKGWDLIEYNELYNYACENFDNQRVFKLLYSSYLYRFVQLFSLRLRHRNFIYIYSLRTDPVVTGIWPFLRLFILLSFCRLFHLNLRLVLSDSNTHLLRSLALLVQFFRYPLISVLPSEIYRNSNSLLRPRGPYIFPISSQTISSIHNSSYFLADPSFCVLFSGSPHPMRRNLFELLEKELIVNHVTYSYSYRSTSVNFLRNSNLNYWNELLSSRFIVTTSHMAGTDNAPVSRRIATHTHLLYRFAEAFVAKRPLIVQPPSHINFLNPYEHFIPFISITQIVEDILYYNSNPHCYDQLVDRAFSNYINVLPKYSLFSYI